MGHAARLELRAGDGQRDAGGEADGGGIVAGKLVRLAARVGRPVQFRKDSVFNKRADKLAKASAKGAALREPLDHRKIRRKTTEEKIQRGSVEMLGQQMTIHLFEEVNQSIKDWSVSSTKS